MRVAIVLFTYDRWDYAKTTLLSTLDGLQLSDQHELAVHIADDGSPEGYREGLLEIAGLDRRVARTGVTNANRGGYGRSYNLATQAVHPWADAVLALEDDWRLSRPFPLDPCLEALTEDGIGCIRLGYVGWTQPLRCEFVAAAGLHWLRFDPDSPEPHVFAGHPRLESTEWQRRVGPWPEGLNPGATEFAVAHLREAREGVVWPVDLVHPYGDAWVHIGTIQARDDQR